MRGFLSTLILLPIAIAIFASLAFVLVKSNVIKTTKSPLPTPTEIPSPSPTPTPTPTPTPSPSPKVVASPKSTATLTTQTTNPAVTKAGNYTVLTFDLGTTVVTDSAAEDDCANDCPTKSLADYIAENGGRAGMNGTYFCPPDYASCAGKVNSFDFPVWNNRKKKWIHASKLSWGGRGMFVFRGGSYQFFPNAASAGAPSDITGGIVNYPSLLSGGNVVLDEGSLSDNLRVTKGNRSGIGAGSGKLFLVVASGANMSDMVSIFQSLGATDALNLDGGGSVALYDGGYKIGPGRSLPNALIVQ